MNSHIILLGVFLCLIAVNARHMDPLDNIEDSSNNGKAKQNGGERHRRKRYHINYGYDYQPPANPFYHPYREHDRNQDLLPEIYRLLDEISTYIRRPPPQLPPQPIYIPYAVPYPICNCATNNVNPTNDQPNITSRFPSMDDTNQIWGIVDEGTVEDDGDGSRPLSFTPISPKRPMKRPALPVEHGTQNERSPSTQAPSFAEPHIPDMCDVFSLSCCNGNETQKKRCFIEAGCANVYNKGDACDQDRLLKIIEEYSKAYAPTVN